MPLPRRLIAMINRLQLLRNVGQFASVDDGANIPLARFTVVHAENGRGKTTLAAVLRSLATGDPIPIAERRRLSAEHPPHVVLDCAGGPPEATFQNDAWSRTLPNMAIFDDVFVDQNVYSGLAVEPEHRQHLHELILGAQGVTLNRRLQQLVTQIENHNTALRRKGSAILAVERGALSVDEFCKLAEDANIDEAIQRAERNLAAAREQDLIRNTPVFNRLSLPIFDVVALDQILQRDLPSLDAAAVAEVQNHLSALGPNGESWVADGMQRVPQPSSERATASCPFCAQDLAGSPIISHYRAYFSRAYAELKQAVSDVLTEIENAHGEDVPAAFERAMRFVVERREFWSRFSEMPNVTLDTAAIGQDWRAAREAVTTTLTAKQAAPLEHMALSEEDRTAVTAYEVYRQALAVLSDQLQNANALIMEVKDQAAASDQTTLAETFAQLKAAKARHTPAIAALCVDYLDEKTAKETAEQQRAETRTLLDKHRTAVFPGYQVAINTYLQRFNADFRLDSMTAANTRSGPTCTYNVIIDDTLVPVAGGTPDPGEPGFRNTLSAGDRNTLALAFFFASLDQDAALATKVVVLDDPISSLDDHRSQTTVQVLRSLTQRVAQVIVLSHRKPFLCQLWAGEDQTKRAALEISRDSIGSTIRSWDVNQDCLTEYDRRHSLLREYIDANTPNNREVAQSIRPVLEAFLRVACPEHFPPGTLLGQFRSRCEQGLVTGQQILSAQAIAELGNLAEYANRFHHDTNPAWQTAEINDGELVGFIRQVLDFARR